MRKQDNSKLIYLLIGVVAVFILVFQYKSWCNAAEFEVVEKYSEEVEEVLSSIPLEEVVINDEGVSEFISEAPILEATSETVVQNFDDSAIVDELKKSNEYWEMFLDSFPVEHTSYLTDYSYIHYRIFPEGTLGGDSGSRVYSLLAGHRYIIDLSSSYNNVSAFRVGLSSSLNYQAPVSILSNGGEKDLHFELSPSSDIYLIVSYPTSASATDILISTIISDTYLTFDSYTLSELGNAVIQNGNNVSEILVYVLITCCFVCCFISLQIAWHTRSQIRKWSGKDSH